MTLKYCGECEYFQEEWTSILGISIGQPRPRCIYKDNCNYKIIPRTYHSEPQEEIIGYKRQPLDINKNNDCIFFKKG